MARILLIFIVAFTLVVLLEAKSKHDWNSESQHHEYKLKDLNNDLMEDEEQELDLDPDLKHFEDEYEADKDDFVAKKDHWRKWKHHHGGHHKKFSKVKAYKLAERMPFVDVLPESDCTIPCKKREICIKDPVYGEPICLDFKELRKSAKLYRQFRRHERKEWTLFEKENYEHDLKQAKEEEEEGELSNMDETKLTASELKELRLKKQNGKNYFSQFKEPVKDTPIVDMEPSEAGDPAVCEDSDFSQMGTRIMGWLHVLYAEEENTVGTDAYKEAHRHTVKKQLEVTKHEECKCLKSAMWEFKKLDKDDDDHLILEERMALEANVSSMEPCMKPFLSSCDTDNDYVLTKEEWCCCFSDVEPPCMKEIDELTNYGTKDSEEFLPRCDNEGYYLPEQCRGLDGDDYECWCVDFNGNHIGEKQANSRAECDKHPLW